MLKVIGAGLGRTGTHSLARALDILGFGPCYTVHDLKKNPTHVDMWNDALEGKQIEWESLYHAYNSAVEWPTVSFLPQLLPKCPDAKIILTLRDSEAWYESAHTTIFEGLELSQYNPNPPSKHRRSVELIRRLILEVMFSGQYRDKMYALQIYTQHIHQVIEMVPPNRLLQYRVTEGWDSLCEFLEVPVPDETFPWLNDRADFLASAPDWFKELTIRLRCKERS